MGDLRKRFTNFIDLLNVLRQMIFCNVPDYFIVYSKVFMHHPVSKIIHLILGNFRILVFYGIWNILRSFSNYFEVPDNCIDCFVVLLKLIEVVPFNMLSNPIYCCQKVFKVQFIWTILLFQLNIFYLFHYLVFNLVL